MMVDEKLLQTAGISGGDTATLEIKSTKDWPEPDVPPDLGAALAAAPQHIQDLWNDITPMARWEWVRWVNATNNPDTRRRRVEVSLSKMNSGKRRPCCFNLSACTDPSLSKNGRLSGQRDHINVRRTGNQPRRPGRPAAGWPTYDLAACNCPACR